MPRTTSETIEFEFAEKSGDLDAEFLAQQHGPLDVPHWITLSKVASLSSTCCTSPGPWLQIGQSYLKKEPTFFTVIKKQDFDLLGQSQSSSGISLLLAKELIFF